MKVNHYKQESQEGSPYLAGDHKAANCQHSSNYRHAYLPFIDRRGRFADHKSSRSWSVMPRSHIHGLDAGLATDVHSWQSVLVRSFP